MSNCESECDCFSPSGPHEWDCHSYVKCTEERHCDKHLAEAEVEQAYLAHVPRYEVMDDQEAREERAQELKDAGHIDWADRIDSARTQDHFIVGDE